VEPLICPFCGGTDLIEGEEREIELEGEYWIIFHWSCMHCHETFDKVLTTSLKEAYEEDEHWS